MKKTATQQIVVYKPQKTQKKKTTKKKKNARKPPATLSRDSEVRKYFAALTDPFSESACGARVPDQYSTHTTTFELRATHTVTAGASGTAGVWVFPNVVTSVVQPNGTNDSTTSLVTWLDGTTTGSVLRWGFDSTVLSSKLQNYRIVGMGVRVTNLSSMVNCQGKLMMGTYPINASYVTRDYNVGGSPPSVVASGTISDTFLKWGIPYSAGSVQYSNLVNYPGTKIVSALEAAQAEYDIVPKPCQPSAFEFREPNDSLQGFGYTGTSRGDPGYLKLDGFEAVFVALTGGVAATSSMDIEVVYHIEGAPIISAGTPASAFVNQQGTQSPINMQGFWTALESALKMPAVKQAAHIGADMLHPMLGKVTRAIF